MDLHSAINAISDVVINRPPALRSLDQIYMKFGDMLIQAGLISNFFNDKETIFIGDGDAIGLCLMHLKSKGILDFGPKKILVLDFDERVVNSINNFVGKNNLKGKISAELYNVANPLPKKYWSKFDAFYTNPPFGSSNDGFSLISFIRRGVEACDNSSIGCIIAADSLELIWVKNVLEKIERTILEEGFIINSINKGIHHYHLEDNPELTSCNIFVTRIKRKTIKYNSKELDHNILENFYGANNPLRYEYIKDNTNGGKLVSKDFKLIPIRKENK